MTDDDVILNAQGPLFQELVATRWRAARYMDARLQTDRRKRTEVRTALGWSERVFCVNCGVPGGAVAKEWADHVFYLCNDCADARGGLPLPEVPPDVEQRIRGGTA